MLYQFLVTSALCAGYGVLAQDAVQGNDTAPFPNITYADAISPNPNVPLGAQSNQTSPPKYPSPWSSGAGDWADAYQKARDAVAQMTLAEKVNITTGTGWSMDACVGNIGSVPRLSIPSFCFQDSPTAMRFTDFSSYFPAGVNVAASWDRGFAFARAAAIGAEYRDKGVNGVLGPVAGPLGRSPAGGRNWEGFSPDPYLTGVLFAESVRGIQSTGQMAVAKHYLLNEQEHFRQVPEATQFGLGNITYPGSSNVDDQTLHELYLWPFADAVRAGVAAVMCSYNRINNSDGCQNSYLMNYVLKGELGFQGFIQSDWQATHSGVSAVLAGLDMTMPGDVVFDSGTSYLGANLTIAVLNGTVPQWRVDDMAVRILAGWYFVGGDAEGNSKPINFNSWTLDTYGSVHSYVGPEYGYGLINEHIDVRQEHGALIRAIGGASTVLLKNINGTLPLSGKEKLTAVFGEDAGSNWEGPNGCPDRGCDQGTLAGAWGSGSGNFPYLISPDAAIQREVTDRYGAYESITSNGALTQIQALARRTGDANVDGACIAFANSDSGEGFLHPGDNFGDRNNLTVWQGAYDMLRNVTSNCDNTILVVHSVGPIDIQEWKDHPNVTAILWAGLPGEQSGNAIADVLYGRVNPNAKLPYTIGHRREDYGTDVLYEQNGPVPQFDFLEGVFTDYRGFDQRNVEPTYEFGFGLSYTTFSYSDLQVQDLHAGPYTPTTGLTEPAPELGSVDRDPSSYVFPSNASFTRVPLYVYPWINDTDLATSYGYEDYGDNSFVPDGAQDGSAQPLHPAGGAPGGNPQLWDTLYRVTVNVTNTGAVAGSEIAQLYISLGGPYDPPKVLRGFEKVPLLPGESAQLGFDVLRRDLSNWDTLSQNWVISEHEKTVYVGASSRNLPLEAALVAQPEGYSKV